MARVDSRRAFRLLFRDNSIRLLEGAHACQCDPGISCRNDRRKAAYRPALFMADVRRGIWSELEGGPVRVDVYRRNLQNSYIDLLSAKLSVRPSVTDDYRALIKAELRDLSAAIGVAMPRATDRQTRAHLADARDQIAKALDPRFAVPTAP